MPQSERVNFSTKIPGATAKAIDLLEKILVFDPKSRITAAEALNHPYLADYQEEVLADGMQTKVTISPFDWSCFIEKDLTVIEWQQKVVELIGVFNAARPRDLAHESGMPKTETHA
jgi:p38 MAP kinase